MTRQTLCKTLLTIAALGIVPAALSVTAQQPPPPEDAKPKLEKEAPISDAEKETRRLSEKIVNGIDVEIASGDKWTKAKRIEKPVLLFGDATRGHNRGSVWAWGEKGRPAATLELWQDSIEQGGRWICSLCNTSGGKIRASRDGDPWWLENDSDVLIKDIPQAPAPAADATQKQRQMKLLPRSSPAMSSGTRTTLVTTCAGSNDPCSLTAMRSRASWKGACLSSPTAPTRRSCFSWRPGWTRRTSRSLFGSI